MNNPDTELSPLPEAPPKQFVSTNDEPLVCEGCEVLTDELHETGDSILLCAACFKECDKPTSVPEDGTATRKISELCRQLGSMDRYTDEDGNDTTLDRARYLCAQILGPCEDGTAQPAQGEPVCDRCPHPQAVHAEDSKVVGCTAGDGSEENPICGCRRTIRDFKPTLAPSQPLDDGKLESVMVPRCKHCRMLYGQHFGGICPTPEGKWWEPQLTEEGLNELLRQGMRSGIIPRPVAPSQPKLEQDEQVYVQQGEPQYAHFRREKAMNDTELLCRHQLREGDPCDICTPPVAEPNPADGRNRRVAAPSAEDFMSNLTEEESKLAVARLMSATSPAPNQLEGTELPAIADGYQLIHRLMKNELGRGRNNGLANEHAIELIEKYSAALAELVALGGERDRLARKVAVIFDQSVYSDSLGVYGSDFRVCRWCGGGSSPGKGDFKHNADCLLDDGALEEQVGRVWEELPTLDALRDRAESAEERTQAAEAQLVAREAILQELVGLTKGWAFSNIKDATTNSSAVIGESAWELALKARELLQPTKLASSDDKEQQ